MGRASRQRESLTFPESTFPEEGDKDGRVAAAWGGHDEEGEGNGERESRMMGARQGRLA